MRLYSKELRLPACFVEEDAQAIRDLVIGIYHEIGYDFKEAGGIHITDYIGDTILHQVTFSASPFPLDVALVWRDAMRMKDRDRAEQVLKAWRAEKEAENERPVGRFSGGRHRLGGNPIAQDTLDALVNWDHKHHRWAQSVGHVAMRPYADRGILK